MQDNNRKQTTDPTAKKQAMMSWAHLYPNYYRHRGKTY